MVLPDGFVQPFQVRDEQREDLIVYQSLRIKNFGHSNKRAFQNIQEFLSK
jgi:hypothetical protein